MQVNLGGCATDRNGTSIRANVSAEGAYVDLKVNARGRRTVVPTSSESLLEGLCCSFKRTLPAP